MSETFPASGAAAVTPSDTTELDCRALYIGGTGNVVVHMPDRADPVTFSNVLAGTVLPVSVRRVLVATTATNIVALY
jgi:hypothetical protein